MFDSFDALNLPYRKANLGTPRDLITCARILRMREESRESIIFGWS